MNPAAPEKEYRLTGFEEYMFLDDTPAFPMYFFQTVRFSGTLDADALEAAYREVITRHPLMNARVEKIGRKFYWHYLSEIPPVLRRTRLETAPMESLPLDIKTEAGARFFIDELTDSEGKRTGYELCFQVHHSCGDAMGTFLFISDILIAYGRRIGVCNAPLPELFGNSLAIRHNDGFSLKQYWRNFWRYLCATLSIVHHEPIPLLPVPKKVDKTIPADQRPLVTKFMLTPEETAAFRESAKRQQMTINDLLIRDIFLAVADFMNAELKPSNKIIRVAMPTNLRMPLHQGMFAANMVSMAFIDWRRKRINRSQKFTDTLRQHLIKVKKANQGLVLPHLCRERRALPGGLQKDLEINRCWSTTVLSNLGRVFDQLPFDRDDQGRMVIGPAVLEDYCGTPPLRYQTLASWACWTYAGRLSFAVRWDDRYMTEDQLNEHVRIFRQTLMESLS